jgi:hypothetical protein
MPKAWMSPGGNIRPMLPFTGEGTPAGIEDCLEGSAGSVVAPVAMGTPPLWGSACRETWIPRGARGKNGEGMIAGKGSNSGMNPVLSDRGTKFELADAGRLNGSRAARVGETSPVGCAAGAMGAAGTTGAAVAGAAAVTGVVEAAAAAAAAGRVSSPRNPAMIMPPG